LKYIKILFGRSRAIWYILWDVKMFCASRVFCGRINNPLLLLLVCWSGVYWATKRCKVHALK